MATVAASGTLTPATSITLACAAAMPRAAQKQAKRMVPSKGSNARLKKEGRVVGKIERWTECWVTEHLFVILFMAPMVPWARLWCAFSIKTRRESRENFVPNHPFRCERTTSEIANPARGFNGHQWGSRSRLCDLMSHSSGIRIGCFSPRRRTCYTWRHVHSPHHSDGSFRPGSLALASLPIRAPLRCSRANAACVPVPSPQAQRQAEFDALLAS